MAQVLGNLGTLVTKDIGRSEEHQTPTSFSNLVPNLPDMEIPSPKDIEQPEPHIEVTYRLE
jgi:hypothetical protein